MQVLKAPMPYFGGKSRVAAQVWARFGNTKNYIEPFFGSGAVLLARPADHFQDQLCVETANDACAYLSNFWRALQAAPEEVARHADWPVSEPDLEARHRWLVCGPGREHIERVKSDAEYFDARTAGWWVWGICQWIGSGWCAEPKNRAGACVAQIPHLSDAGTGVHKMPLLGNSGVGVHQERLARKLPAVGDAGRGIHRRGQRLPQQLPHLGNGGTVDVLPCRHSPNAQLPHVGDAGRGVHAPSIPDLYAQLERLSQRLRRVRVCCGDWKRITGPSVTTKHGITGVFLDPPYSQTERASVYAQETDCAAEVRQWCVENGSNPLLRIAICGYAGEGHEVLEACGWDVLEWKARGGYGSQGGNTRGRENSHRERIWFSPNCVKPIQGSLFDA